MISRQGARAQREQRRAAKYDHEKARRCTKAFRVFVCLFVAADVFISGLEKIGKERSSASKCSGAPVPDWLVRRVRSVLAVVDLRRRASQSAEQTVATGLGAAV